MAEALASFVADNFTSAEEVTPEWVANTYESNFTDFEATSAGLKLSLYEDEHITKLQALCQQLSKYAIKVNSADIWKVLAERKVSGKQLSVMLWYAVEGALKERIDASDLSAGAAGAVGYLALCSIKGASSAAYNPYFYQKCIEVFRRAYRLYAADGAATNAPKRGGKATRGGGRGRGAKRSQAQEMMDETMNMTSAGPNVSRSTLRELLEDACDALYMFLGNIALSSNREAAVLTADLVREVMRIDWNKTAKVSPVSSYSQLSDLSVCEKALALSHRLAENKHGTGGELVYSRIVMPRLALWSLDTLFPVPGVIPVALVGWKEAMVRFIEARAASASDQELNVILMVLDTIFVRSPDRSEYRLKIAQMMVEVVSVLPSHTQQEFVQRVHRLANNTKTSLRTLSIEIVPLLLSTIDRAVLSERPPEKRADPNETKAADKTKNQTRAGDSSDEEMDDGEKKDGDEEEEEEKDVNTEEEIAEEDRRLAAEREKKKGQKKKKNRGPAEPVDPLPALYTIVIRSCLDKNSTVRSRAVQQLAGVLDDRHHCEGVIAAGQKLLESCPKIFSGEDGDEEEEEDEGVDVQTSLNASDLEIENLVLHIVLQLMDDDKAAVRKSSLQSMLALFPALQTAEECEDAIAKLKRRCVDALPMVRRQAAECVTGLLRDEKHPMRGRLEELWLCSVLPQITDREQAVQTACAKTVNEVIVTPVSGRDTSDGTWSLLGRIEQEDNHRRLLLRALFQLSSNGDLKERVVDVLLRKLDELPQHSDVLWMLLSDMSVVFKIHPQKCLAAWNSIEDGQTDNKVRYVARILAQGSDKLKADEKRVVYVDMQDKIKHFRIDSAHIPAVFLAMAKLMDALGEEATGVKDLERFGRGLLDACASMLYKMMEKNQHHHGGDEMEDEEDEIHVTRAIMTIGEVIQFSPGTIRHADKIVHGLKWIIASDDIDKRMEMDRREFANSAIPTPVPTVNGGAAAAGGSAQGGESRPPSAASCVSGASAATQPSSQSTGYASQQPVLPPGVMAAAQQGRHAPLFTPAVRAYAVLAYGKFCLMDEKMAKEAVPVFATQLKINTDHVIRNNIVLVICDLCIRYTLLVDRYSPIVAGCLKDRSTLVRHQTLESLTNLIKEQFLKWEGQIMYRFVSTILDEDKKIREYAEFCLKDVLMLQFPSLFFSHFMECLLYFNDVVKKWMPGCDDLAVSSNLKFTLSGQRNQASRMTLYKFMIATFDDKQKFMVMSRIGEEVLSPIASGEMRLREPKVQQLLQDAFEILSSEEMKLEMSVGRKADDGDDDDEPEVPKAIETAAKKLITAAYRKGIIEHFMPHMLRMREYLTTGAKEIRVGDDNMIDYGPPLDHRLRARFIRGCMKVLRAICRDHKQEIDEVLAGDKQLRSEIEYEINLLEEREQREAELARVNKRREEERLRIQARERRKSRRTMDAEALARLQAEQRRLQREGEGERQGQVEADDATMVAAATAAGDEGAAVEYETEEEKRQREQKEKEEEEKGKGRTKRGGQVSVKAEPASANTSMAELRPIKQSLSQSQRVEEEQEQEGADEPMDEEPAPVAKKVIKQSLSQEQEEKDEQSREQGEEEEEEEEEEQMEEDEPTPAPATKSKTIKKSASQQEREQQEEEAMDAEEQEEEEEQPSERKRKERKTVEQSEQRKTRRSKAVEQEEPSQASDDSSLNLPRISTSGTVEEEEEEEDQRKRRSTLAVEKKRSGKVSTGRLGRSSAAVSRASKGQMIEEEEEEEEESSKKQKKGKRAVVEEEEMMEEEKEEQTEEKKRPGRKASKEKEQEEEPPKEQKKRRGGRKTAEEEKEQEKENGDFAAPSVVRKRAISREQTLEPFDESALIDPRACSTPVCGGNKANFTFSELDMSAIGPARGNAGRLTASRPTRSRTRVAANPGFEDIEEAD